MKHQKNVKRIVLAFAVLACLPWNETAFAADEEALDPNPKTITAEPSASREDKIEDEIVVWGEGRRETNFPSPESLLLAEDLTPITAATTEDLVKYEPSLIIRRRYVGDPNGTMGIRGSNMFQTSRSMVFADGIPLHYFLQTRWNGSPRWGLVNADEIGFVEVVYGPFSAEYSGNAMGGVVNIETVIPTRRRLHLEGAVMQQSFDELGFNDSMEGFKGFASYGEHFGKLSVYAAAHRLENDSQPLDYRFGRISTPTGGEIPVTGALGGTDEFGRAARYFGNTGSLDSLTDQLKTKIGYELGDRWSTLFNLGYERRDIIGNALDNYLAGADGNPIWDGDVVQDGAAWIVRGRDFTESDQDRRTLLFGGRLQGLLSDTWHLEASLSLFEILEDETRTSLRNPADPAFTPAGTVRDFDEAGWQTAEVKLQNDRFLGHDDISLITGYRFESYSLGVTNYNSADYAAGVRTSLANASGGDTQLQAPFAQVNWQLGPALSVTFGGRLESWESENGFFNNRGDLDRQIDRSETRFSPKFSLGYAPSSRWTLRVSSAKAYRFPIVEELFQNERRTNGTSIANANLDPEDGLHHNLMIERAIPGGQIRLNLFTETIDDVIFNQTTIVDNRSITTFLPIEEVQTDGVELGVNRSGMLDGRMSVRFNATYLDATITENATNRDLEGKTFPRMPDWRANLLLNFQITDRWDLGGGVRASSNSFGELDNSDTAEEVFGAHDEYLRVNLKTSYDLRESLRLSLGIDNLTDEVAYVHHPWPGRTTFLEVSVQW